MTLNLGLIESFADSFYDLSCGAACVTNTISTLDLAFIEIMDQVGYLQFNPLTDTLQHGCLFFKLCVHY